MFSKLRLLSVNLCSVVERSILTNTYAHATCLPSHAIVSSCVGLARKMRGMHQNRNMLVTFSARCCIEDVLLLFAPPRPLRILLHAIPIEENHQCEWQDTEPLLGQTETGGGQERNLLRFASLFRQAPISPGKCRGAISAFL